MDVFIGTLTPEWICYLAGNHDFFALYLKKVDIGVLTQKETLSHLINYLQDHYKSNNDLIYFLREHFMPLFQPKRNNLFFFELINGITSELEPEYYSFLKLCIMLKIAFDFGSLKSYKACKYVVHPNSHYFVFSLFDGLSDILRTMTESTKNGEQSGVIFCFNYIEWIISICKNKDDITNDLFQIFSLRTMHEKGSNIPFISIPQEKFAFKKIPKIKLKIKPSTWTIDKYEIMFINPFNSFYVNNICFLPTKQVINIPNSSFDWNIKDMIETFKQPPIEEMPNVPFFEQKSQQNFECVKIQHYSKKLITASVFYVYSVWLNTHGLSLMMNFNTSQQHKSEFVKSFVETYNNGSNYSKKILSQDVITHETGAIIGFENKEKFNSKPPHDMRFVVCYKKTHYTPEEEGLPGILTVRTTLYDQKNHFVFDILLHFIKKKELYYAKNNNQKSHDCLWNLFIYDYYLDYSQYKKDPFCMFSGNELEQLHMVFNNTKPTHLLYQNSEIILDKIFPDMNILHNVKEHLNHYMFNWKHMSVDPSMIKLNMAYLPMKNDFYINQLRKNYKVDLITVDLNSQQLKNIVTTRFKLFLMLTNAIPEKEYERFKNQKRNQLKEEKITFKKDKLDPIESATVENPSFLFCWSTLQENVINIEEILPKIEEYLIHDPEELLNLQIISRNIKDSQWKWWKKEKPYFNVQKCCRELLNAGLSIEYYPIPVTSWVIDGKMINI